MIKTAKKLEKIIYFFILCMIFITSTMLFYFQSIKWQGKYPSDLPQHISHALDGQGYSINRILFSICYKITNNSVGVCLFLATVIVLTVFVSYRFFVALDQLRKVNGNKSIYRWSAVSLIFVTSLFIPFVYEMFYKGALGLQAWHNSTYMEMRLFGILTLVFYFRLDQVYLHSFKKNGISFFLFSILLMITTLIKPNFLIGFAPMMALGLLYDLVTNIKDMKCIKKIIVFGCMVFPALIVLYMQNHYLYVVRPSSSQIVFDFGTQYMRNGNPIAKLVLFLFFPLLVLLHNKKRLIKEKWYIKVWIFWLIEFLVYLCFIETGERATHGNFGWGLLMGNYLVFMSTVYFYLNNTRELRTQTKKTLYEKIYVYTGLILWTWHFFSGLIYFIILLHGVGYGI